MAPHWFRVFRKITLVAMLTWEIYGCAPVQSIQTKSQATLQPSPALFQADLASTRASVRAFIDGNSPIEVQPNHTTKVGAGDRVELDQNGYGTLTFQAILEVELFRNAQIRLVQAQQEPDGYATVSLNQIQGHVRVNLGEAAVVHLTLETENATITTHEAGTQFIVCHAPGVVTCVIVLNGAADVAAQGKTVTVRGGEATYIFKGEAPPTAVCAPAGRFLKWEVAFVSSSDTPAAGDLVGQLPKEPCMVKIVAGTYDIGSVEPDQNHSALRNVVLTRDFYIDTYEVTNLLYKKYLAHTGGQPPESGLGDQDHPVKGVTWDQASDYCTWANKRLPSEEEWEIAGRWGGQSAHLYPWGNEAQDGWNLPSDDTYSVGSYAVNKSAFGVYDMVGNVWEWVGSPYDSLEAGLRILRGGRFGYFQDLAYRQPAKSDDPRFVPFAGFRCASDQPE